MGDRFLIRLDRKRRARWMAAAKALFLPHLTTFIKAAADEKAERVLSQLDGTRQAATERNQTPRRNMTRHINWNDFPLGQLPDPQVARLAGCTPEAVAYPVKRTEHDVIREYE